MSAHATAVPGRLPRLLGFALLVLAVVHSIVIGLWSVPDNPVRDAAGVDRLGGYVKPYFGQSWSVFAPTPRRVDENFAIRARVVDPATGEHQVTDWFDVTADDRARTLIDVNPVRMVRASHALASGLNTAFARFNVAQREIVQADLADPRDPDLRRRLLAPDTGPRAAPRAAVAAFLRSDEMSVRFATMYATAKWGAGVAEVQVRVGRQAVPPYEERTALEDVPFRLRTFGWRAAIAGEAQAQSGFDDWVRR